MRRAVVVTLWVVLCASLCACQASDPGKDGWLPRWPNHPPTVVDTPSADDIRALPESAAFPFAVTTGDPAPDSVVFWTRYVGSEKLELVAWTGAGRVDLHQSVPIAPSEGIVKERLGGLEAGVRYEYAFVELDEAGKPSARSPIGRTHTAFAPGTLQPLTFIASGDADKAKKPFTLFDAVAEETDAAFIVFNGDTVYADGATTVEEYRQEYRTNWEDPSMRNALPRHAFISNWDDHEVVNNWHPDDTDAGLIANARQAFLEYSPIVPEADGQIYRSFRWGDTAEIIVIDSRGERSYSPRRYMSDTQMAWLKQRLSTSPAVFKFIVNSVPIATFAAIKAGDRWEGYPASRNEILDFIVAEGITNTYWLSADFHAAIVAKLPTVPGSRDFVTGPVAKDLVQVWELVALLDHIEFASGQSYNYFVFEADPATETLTVKVKDPDGQIFFEGTYDGVDP